VIGARTHVALAGHVGAGLDCSETGATAPSGPLLGLVDVARLGLAGHSMGGKISMLTASQDLRPRAVVGIDAVDAAGSPLPVSATDYPSVTPERMAAITVPIAMIGELTNATCSGALCQACAPAADNFPQYYEHAGHAPVEIDLGGPSPKSFRDAPPCRGRKGPTGAFPRGASPTPGGPARSPRFRSRRSVAAGWVART